MRKCIHGDIDRYANGRCAICSRLNNKIRYLSDPTKQAMNSKKWLKNNPEKAKEMRRRQKLKAHFGITPEEYTRIFQLQNGRCAICGRHQIDLNKTLSVDHCHETGKVRGLLCMQCNLKLGHYEKSKHLISAFNTYIQKFK